MMQSHTNTLGANPEPTKLERFRLALDAGNAAKGIIERALKEMKPVMSPSGPDGNWVQFTHAPKAASVTFSVELREQTNIELGQAGLSLNEEVLPQNSNCQDAIDAIDHMVEGARLAIPSSEQQVALNRVRQDIGRRLDQMRKESGPMIQSLGSGTEEEDVMFIPREATLSDIRFNPGAANTFSRYFTEAGIRTDGNPFADAKTCQEAVNVMQKLVAEAMAN